MTNLIANHLQDIAISVILIAIIFIAIGKIPYYKMNRASFAFVASSILVGIGFITLEEAYDMIDWNTIAFLLSMMIINANLRLAGFFNILTQFALKFIKTKKGILFAIIFGGGFLSAFLMNDTICVMLTPFVLEFLLALKLNPIPYLIALAISSNFGSAMTLIGNPQNMIIGISSKIPFIDFFIFAFIPSVVALIFSFFFILFIYRKEFYKNEKLEVESLYKQSPYYYKPLLIKSLTAFIVFTAMLFSNINPALSSILSASIILFTRRIKPQRIFQEIDWSLLLFFSCLFIITGSIGKTSLFGRYSLNISNLLSENYYVFTGVSASLSNLISNVPAVMLLKNFIAENQKPLWILLAISSTFAGNLTLIGSVANLIVAESAARKNVFISFNEYLKVGFLLTIISLFLSSLYFALLFN